MAYFSITISVFLIVILSLSLSLLFKKRISECLHTAIFTVIVVLYCFYCINALRVGLIAVTATILTSAIYAVFQTKKRKVQLQSFTFCQIVSPGLVIFLLVAAFCVIYTRNFKVILWDEERLWGAVPKAMHETGKLQVGKQALVFEKMQSYPPGMMLFGYFITAFSDMFYECQLFAGYGLFSAVLLIAGAGKLDRIQSRRRWILVLPLTVAMIFLPCIFTSNGGDGCHFYLSLFIDPILGILTGFLFYKAADDPLKDIYETVDFALGLFVLTILKDSGIEFSILILLLAVVIWRIDHDTIKSLAPERRRYIAVPFTICAVSVCTAYFSWKIILTHAGITNHIEFKLYRYGLEVWKRLWGYISGKPVISTRGMFGYKCPEIIFSLAAVLAICAGIGALRLILIHGKNLTAELMVRVFMVLAFILFLYGYLCAFNNNVESMDKLPSFQRYMTTLAGCAVTYEFLGLLSLLFEMTFGKAVMVKTEEVFKEKNFFVLKKTAAISGIVIRLALCVICWKVMDVWSWNKYDDPELMKTVSETAEFLKAEGRTENKNPIKICNLMKGSISENAMLHQRLYFELLGSGVQIVNYYQETRIAHVNPEEADTLDDAAVKECAQIWCDELKESGCDYIYVMQIDSWTERIFYELDAELISKNETLYKITTDESNDIRMQRVSQKET